jgi:hypothetical protein
MKVSFMAEMKSEPNESSPTKPTMLTLMGVLSAGVEPSLLRDSLAHATAWFAPLPPKPVSDELASSVSPPAGTRGVRVMKSTFKEPITAIEPGISDDSALVEVILMFQ